MSVIGHVLSAWSNIRGDIKSLNPELALYGSKNLCARTDNVFLQLSQVSEGAVSLIIFEHRTRECRAKLTPTLEVTLKHFMFNV